MKKMRPYQNKLSAQSKQNIKKTTTIEARLYANHPVFFGLLFSVFGGVMSPVISCIVPKLSNVTVRTVSVATQSTVRIHPFVLALSLIICMIFAILITYWNIKRRKMLILPLTVLIVTFLITSITLTYSDFLPSVYQDVYTEEEWNELKNTSMKFELGSNYTYNWASGKLESDCWDFYVYNDGLVEFIFTHDIEDNIVSDAWRVVICNENGKVVNYRFISMDAAKTDMKAHMTKGKYYLTFKTLNEHYRDNPLYVDTTFVAESL